MNPNRKAFYPDVVVGYACVIIATWYFGFLYGQITERQAPKVCAKVMGMTPVYSTADECTYVMGGTYGKAYWKYLAVKEGKR